MHRYFILNSRWRVDYKSIMGWFFLFFWEGLWVGLGFPERMQTQATDDFKKFYWKKIFQFVYNFSSTMLSGIRSITKTEA